MKKNIIYFIFLFILFIDTPLLSNEITQQSVDHYMLKISKKFSNTYCNTSKFGTSRDGALKFAIGETNKEFLNNKLNKFIDYEFLNKNILFELKNNCQITDLPIVELDNLAFK